MVDITTKIGSIKLNNPTILASGILDEDAGSMQRVFDNGAGAVVTKSIGLKPRKGYSNPSVIELDYGILNAVGLANPGIIEIKEEINKLKSKEIPVIGSIYASNSKEFTKLAIKMQEYKVDAIELNMSCPHAKGYGLEIGSDKRLVKEIVSNVKDSIDLSVFVKISPNLSNISEVAKAAEKGNADGIVAVNTVKAMKIDIDTKMPVLSNKIGGYSGKAIKPIGVRCVYEISENVDIPIIGVGGITTGKDVIEYLMAGSSAVQIGSGVYYQGVNIFKDVCKQIINWMKENNLRKLNEIIGVAHK